MNQSGGIVLTNMCLLVKERQHQERLHALMVTLTDLHELKSPPKTLLWKSMKLFVVQVPLPESSLL